MFARGFLVSLFAAFALMVPTAAASSAPHLSLPAGDSTDNGNVYLGDSSVITVTVNSDGSSPLDITSVSIYAFPGNSEYFSIEQDNCSGQSVESGDHCTFQVRFTASVVGHKFTSVRIDSNDVESGGMKFFGISGTGINPGIDADAASHNFGTVQVGEYGTDKTFTIENDGTSDLNATATITGTDAAEFFFSSQPNCASVTPDSTCQIIVNLRPLGSAGPRSANLVIANNTKNENPVTIPLTATASAPHFTSEPLGLGFGQFDLFDDPPATRPLTIKSDGTADLKINGMVIDPLNSNSNAFTLDQGECVDDLAIAPGDDCTLNITFKAGSFGEGSYNTSLLVFTNNGDQSVPVSAARTSGGMSTDSSADVGDVELGQTGSATLTLTSTGTAPLKMSPPVIDGPDAGMFSVDQPSDCNGLASGQSCEVTVHFTPTSLAGKQAGLTLSGNFGSTGVLLTGSGTQAFVNVPGDITFPTTIVGKQVTWDESLISNGSAPFSLGSLTIEGADASMFSVETTGSCASVAHGDECPYSITYKPTSTGSHEAQLKITGNLAGGSRTIPLSGTARNLTPAKVSLKLTGAKQVKPGKTVTLTARISKSGEEQTGDLTLKTVVPKKMAASVKPVRIPHLGAGNRTVTRKITIKVRRSAKSGQKLKVEATVSGGGLKKAGKAGKTVTIR